jgi:hypothetical protein
MKLPSPKLTKEGRVDRRVYCEYKTKMTYTQQREALFDEKFTERNGKMLFDVEDDTPFIYSHKLKSFHSASMNGLKEEIKRGCNGRIKELGGMDALGTPTIHIIAELQSLLTYIDSL